MENRDGRDLGGNKMDRLLHFRRAADYRGLHAAAADTYAIARAALRLLLAGLLIGLFYLLLLIVKAVTWIFD